jgi:hypothetical protein
MERKGRDILSGNVQTLGFAQTLLRLHVATMEINCGDFSGLGTPKLNNLNKNA